MLSEFVMPLYKPGGNLLTEILFQTVGFQWFTLLCLSVQPAPVSAFIGASEEKHAVYHHYTEPGINRIEFH